VKTNLITRLARPTPANDFRLFLQQELGRRCTRNPQYSLRAFAKFLAVDHATLSQWLRGRRRLTTKAIERLGGRLKLSAKSIAAYVANERLLGGRDEAEPRRREVQQLASDTANLIADWYHYAILELVRLREFKADSRWIGRVLGISVDEVNVALQRLLRLGLLEMTDSGRWRDKSGDTTASIDEFTTVAIQRLFEQSRRLSLAALTAAPPELREHSSMTLAMAVARVPAVIEALARFREELLDRCLRIALLDRQQNLRDAHGDQYTSSSEQSCSKCVPARPLQAVSR